MVMYQNWKLFHCNFINNQFYNGSGVFFLLPLGKSFGQLLNTLNIFNES